eukprot:237322_1
MSEFWNTQIYTAVLFSFPLGCFFLIILQIISDSYFNNGSTSAVDNDDRKSQRSSRKLLYIIYSTGMACGLVGFSLHASTMPQWCEKYGFLPCFCFLGLSKAILYIFFLRRAESAQGITINRCKTIVFRYVAPAYLFAYWIIYMILTSVVFAGKLVDDQLSNCVFAKGAWWFSILAACIDMFNAIGSLALFIHPLVMAMKQAGLTRKDQKEYLKYLGFVTVMKWNICLTAIAAVSSMVAIICFYTTQEYAWFFCLGDPFINGLCTFLMVGPNRRMISIVCCRSCQTENTLHREALQYVMEIDGMVIQMGPSATETPVVKDLDMGKCENADSHQSGKENTITAAEMTVNVQSNGEK